METEPKVSVVMSVFNGAKFLSAAIESILGQTHRHLEFLIVDDGSTDDSTKILRHFESKDSRIKLTCRENTGLTRALNEALSLASGEFIARMDSDDLAEADRLSQQLIYFDQHADCVALGSRVLLIDPDGDPLAEEQPPETHESILATLWRGIGALPHPTAMIRHGALKSVGGYREEFVCAQDLDLWLRLSEIGKLANLNQTLLRYRLHANSITIKRRELQLANAEQAVRDAYHRRGEAVPQDFQMAQNKIATPERNFRSWAKMALRSGNTDTAVKHFWNAVRVAPFSPSNLSLVPKFVAHKMKKAA